MKDQVRASVYGLDPTNESGWVRAVCPRCLREGHRGALQGMKKNLAYNVISTVFMCWRCPLRGALSDNKHRYVELRLPPPPKAELPADAVRVLPRREFTEEAYSYLRNRGVDDYCIESLDIRCVRKHWKYRDAVLFPHWGVGDELEGYVANLYKLKVYRNSTGLRREGTLFGINHLFSSPVVLVVEGVFDALRYYPFAVACLGKPTDQQKRLLVAAKSRVVLALDNDAKRMGWAVAQQLKLMGCDASSIELPLGQDPGSCDPNIIGRILDGYRQDSSQGRTARQGEEEEGVLATGD